MKCNTVIWGLCLFFALVPVGCKNNREKKQRLSPQQVQKVLLEYNKRLNQQVEKEIAAYINQSEQQFLKTSTGLYYTVLENTAQNKPAKGNAVVAEMQYYLLDSVGLKPVYELKTESFVVGKHDVPAINEAVTLMSVGSKLQLVVSPYLGFGLNGDGNKIPPTRPFVVNISLLKVN